MAGTGWAEVLLVAAVAGVSGLLAGLGRTGAAAGLVWLLATAMGIGLPTDTPWWQYPLLFLLGGLPLILLSLTDALRDRHRGERTAVATAYRAAADLLTADELLTAAGLAPARAEARSAVTAAMDRAHETLLVHRIRPPRPGSASAPRLQRLDELVGLLAVAPLAPRVPPAVTDRYADLLRCSADLIETGSEAPLPHPGPPPVATASGPEERALYTALLALHTECGGVPPTATEATQATEPAISNGETEDTEATHPTTATGATGATGATDDADTATGGVAGGSGASAGASHPHGARHGSPTGPDCRSLPESPGGSGRRSVVSARTGPSAARRSGRSSVSAPHRRWPPARASRTAAGWC
ncbi:FUSC family membrane protein [Streptomyces sp. NPDC097619]|uniref:FUSC family membrane protein n=1 Tax=Streptomyces sp. NPDC097619 TaxID=3157228 RepID=UPI00332AF7E6